MTFSFYRVIPCAMTAILLTACDPATPKKSEGSEPAAMVSEKTAAQAYHYQPDVDITALFERVQTEKIFADSKTFVDAIPTLPPVEVMALYEQQKDQADFDLKTFVETHFELPEPLPAVVVDQETDMQAHLKAHWTNLVRDPKKTSEYSTLIPLPNPYVVPGGRFREMFYWDSYFTIVGLLLSDQDELALGMIDNFAHLIDQYGYVPNGNRNYFLSRSQPPFFAASLQLYAKYHGIESVIAYLPQLEKEHHFWMDHQASIPTQAFTGQRLVVLGKGEVANRYYGAKEVPRAEAFNKEAAWAEGMEPAQKALFFRNLRAACESGWDFSGRWFADGKTKTAINTMDLIPVDLSSLLYSLESTLAQFYRHTGQQEQAEHFEHLAAQRKDFINRYHFDPASGTYQDYNWVSGERTGYLSLAMAFPLFVGAATPDAAASVAKIIEGQFLKAGGVVTSLTQTDEQWDYPNGWAPLQYVTVQGLLHYEQSALAREIAQRWLSLNEQVYRTEGKMMEKYDVVDISRAAGGGNYPNQDGFGWTNGVDLAFYELLQQDSND